MDELPIAIANIAIFQGATFDQTLFYETGEPPTPFNLSGYTAKMQIRSRPESKAVILELSTTNGRITLNYGSQNGAIRLLISADITATLPPRDEAVYDLVLYSGTIKTRILQGSVVISPEVTR